MEDIFNESDEDSSDNEEKKPQDDVDDEENMSEDKLLSLELSKSSQDRLNIFFYISITIYR